MQHTDSVKMRPPHRLVWEMTRCRVPCAEGATQHAVRVSFSGAPLYMHAFADELARYQAEGFLPANIEVKLNGRNLHLTISGIAVNGVDVKAKHQAETALNEAIEGTAKMLGYGDRAGMDNVVGYISKLPKIAERVTLSNRLHLPFERQ